MVSWIINIWINVIKKNNKFSVGKNYVEKVEVN